MKAKPLDGYVTVISAWSCEGVRGIIVPCADYDAFKLLPKAVEFENIILGLSGWNSDRGTAYYTSSSILAKGK